MAAEAVHKRFHALLVLALLLLSSAPRASEGPITDLAYQTQISVQSVAANVAIVRITFLNLTYFSKPDMNAARKEDDAGAAANPPAAMSPTSQESQSYHADDLQGAPLYFLLEGQNVSADGSNSSCNPATSDDGGNASCTLLYYYNGTDYLKISDRKSCSSMQVIYPGETRGSIQYKPTSETFLVCPESGSALSSLGSIIMNALESSNNLLFCFPAILIAGLLITSMYYSGRDPLSLFDLTTPRLPKTKQARISGGSTAMAIRTAVSRYVQAKNQSRKSVEAMVGMAAAKSGADKKAAKKAVKDFFKRLDKAMAAVVLKKDVSEGDVERVFRANYQGELLSIFKKYGIDDTAKRTYLRKYFAKAMHDFDTYAAMEVGMRTMQTSRAPYGGRLYKKINAWQQKATEKVMGMEDKAKYLKMPFRRTLQFTPLGLPLSIVDLPYALAAVPHKLIDMVAQYRSTKGWIRGTRRKAFGHLASKVLTKENSETGERESRLAGKAFKAAMEGTGVASAAKWMYGWDYDGYVKSHSILTKKIGHLNDAQAKYLWDLSESLSISPYLAYRLLNPDAKAEEALEEWAKRLSNAKQGKEYALKQLAGELEAALLAEAHQHGAFQQKIDEKKQGIHAMFSADRETEKLLLQHVEWMKAMALHKDGDLSVLFTHLAIAKGADTPDVRASLKEIERIENQLKRDFGIARLKDELVKDLKDKSFGRFSAFDKEKLERWSRDELELVWQHDTEIARLLHNNGKLSNDELVAMAKRRVLKPDNEEEVRRKVEELRSYSVARLIAEKQGLAEELVAGRINWMRANGKIDELRGHMSADEIEAYKREEGVRAVAAKRLEEKLRAELGGCEAVEHALNSKGARFLLEIGDHAALMHEADALAMFNSASKTNYTGAQIEADEKLLKKFNAMNGRISEELFNEHIGLSLQKAVISAMNREVGEDGEIVRNGVLSQFTSAVGALNRAVAVKMGGDDALAAIALGKDQAGSILAYQFKQVCSAIGMKFDHPLESINDFELLFAKGVQRNQLSRELTEALERYILAGRTQDERKAAAARIAGMFAVEATSAEARKYNSSLAENLMQIAEARQRLGGELERLHGASKYAEICEFLGLKQHFAQGGASKQLDAMILERMSMLEERGNWHSPQRRQVNAIREMLHITDEGAKKMLFNTSYTDYVFGAMLAKTENSLHKWGGEMLRTGELLNGGFSRWVSPTKLSAARDEFKNGIDVNQRVEYAATRKSFLFTQYSGESSQQFETLLYVSRAMNRGAEFAISKGLGATNAAGSMLGAYDSQTQYTLQSFAMQRVFYKNLVDEESLYYDKKFADHMKGVKKAGAQLSDYDEYAAIELKRRGMLFMDARRGVPYVITADNSGILPVFEFNKSQLEHYWDGSKHGIIVKNTDKNGGKADVRDYGPLFANLKISDFGSEVIGVVAARNANKDKSDISNPHFERVDPRQIAESSQLFEAAKINVPLRSSIAKVIAGVGIAGGSGEAIKGADGKEAKPLPLLHFVNGKAYVDHYAKAEFSLKAAPHMFKLGETKAYQKAVAKVGETFYDIFYDDTIRTRSWYAAQARARQALDEQGNAMKGDWMAGGSKRLNANMFFADHQEDENISAFRHVLNGIEEARERSKENEGKRRVSETLAELATKLADNDKSAQFLKRIYAFTDKDTATLQSLAYGAEKSMEALKAMYKAGNLDKDEYTRLYAAARSAEKSLNEKYLESRKDNYDFTKAVIAVTGSHENTYYGSGRSWFTFFNPSQDFQYKQSYQLGFGMSIESTAMRAGEYNRGGRLGADSFEKMNMNTGQGVYENQRWWATSLYEQEMVAPMAFSLYVHKALLPFASHVYRRMIGLSSPLQRTELETEWGKPSFPILAFFGLKRGVNDNIAASVQMLQDYSGGSQILAAMRKGGKVTVDADGNVGVQRSGAANRLDSWAVDSPSLLYSDAQIRYLNRLQDRLKTLEARGDDKVKENGSYIYVHDGQLVSDRDEARRNNYEQLTVKKLLDMGAHAEHQLDYKYDLGVENELRRYDELLKPYITVQLKDEQQESVKISDGGGHYFNIDGSRRRPAEIFMGDHFNTWSQVIPGMTEYGPWMNKTLSPTAVNYFEHWGKTYGDIQQAVGLQVVKSGSMYGDYNEEAGVWSRKNLYDTHRDAYRDVFRMETPAAMQVMKMQSYSMMYEGVRPWWELGKGLAIMPFNILSFGTLNPLVQSHDAKKRTNEFRGNVDAARIDAQLAAHGIGTMADVGDNVSFKQSGYDEIQQARDAVRRSWFYQRWRDSIYDHYVHRSEMLALASDEHRRNMKVFMRQQMIMGL